MRKHDHWETGKIEAYVDWQVRKPACCLVREYEFQITSNWLYRLYATDLLPFIRFFSCAEVFHVFVSYKFADE